MNAIAPLIRPTALACAKIALVQTDAVTKTALGFCLSQMGLEVVEVADPIEFSKRKFEGCVVDLRHDHAQIMLEAARRSTRNRRVVVFAVYDDPSQVRRFSRYGINALFPLPLHRTEVLKVLRSTQTLLLHELRRYARIPLATEVELRTNVGCIGLSRDVSGGGLSVNLSSLPTFAEGQSVTARIVIPPDVQVTLRGLVSWIHRGQNLVGVRFLPDQEGLKPVRLWIEEYLGIR